MVLLPLYTSKRHPYARIEEVYPQVDVAWVMIVLYNEHDEGKAFEISAHMQHKTGWAK